MGRHMEGRLPGVGRSWKPAVGAVSTRGTGREGAAAGASAGPKHHQDLPSPAKKQGLHPCPPHSGVPLANLRAALLSASPHMPGPDRRFGSERPDRTG